MAKSYFDAGYNSIVEQITHDGELGDRVEQESSNEVDALFTGSFEGCYNEYAVTSREYFYGRMQAIKDNKKP